MASGLANRVQKALAVTGALILTAALAVPAIGTAAFAASPVAADDATALKSQAEDLPASFDLRDTGVVGPVRNQKPWGSCWAFATMAASEASILSEQGNTYAKSKLRFSPRHLAWFAGTALPDAKTMAASSKLSSYASQAGEGTTMRAQAGNDYGSPFETGGFTFEAAIMMASGVGPVLEDQAPYRNDENMAEVSKTEPVATLKKGQTITDYLAAHPGEYNGYSEVDDEGSSGLVVPARREVTAALISSNMLAYYATRPAFDDAGHLIVNVSEKTPRYTWGLSQDERFSHAYELEEYRVLPEPTGGVAGKPYQYNPAATEAIKRELLAGRGVAASVFEDNVQEERGYAYYTNPSTWSQYTFDSSGANKIQGSAHSVCIVGWDDNWGVDKFKSGSTKTEDGKEVSYAPPGPGAWIVRNSYGAEGQAFPDSGTTGYRDKNGKHTGYFYLSYYDMSISRPSSFDFDASGHVSDYINQYDLMPAPVPHTEQGIGDRFANVFTAEADERVHALSVETEQPNTHVRLELWKLGANDSLADGKSVASVEADFAYGGLHRLSLKDGVDLDKGERFAVVGRLTVADDGQLTTADDKGQTVARIPVHRDVNQSGIEKFGNKIDSYVTSVVNPGESFLEVKGAWLDWSDQIGALKTAGTLVSHYDYDNFPVKAYADARTEPEDDEEGDEKEDEDKKKGSKSVSEDEDDDDDSSGESTTSSNDKHNDKSSNTKSTASAKKTTTQSVAANRNGQTSTVPRTGDSPLPIAALVIALACSFGIIGIALRSARSR